MDSHPNFSKIQKRYAGMRSHHERDVLFPGGWGKAPTSIFRLGSTQALLAKVFCILSSYYDASQALVSSSI